MVYYYVSKFPHKLYVGISGMRFSNEIEWYVCIYHYSKIQRLKIYTGNVYWNEISHNCDIVST